MSPAAKSILYFSIYPFGMGIGLLFIPNLVLGLFGFEQANEIWVRVLGLLAFSVGILYFYSARSNQTGFFRATVVERTVFFLGMLGLTFLFRMTPMLAILGAVDLLGAIWTGLALRQ